MFQEIISIKSINNYQLFMKIMKTNLSLKFSFACIFAMLMFFTGCSNEDESNLYKGSKDNPDRIGVQGMVLTDGITEAQLGNPEEIHCNADAQTITLRAVSMYLPEYPYPTELKFKMWEWNEERGDFYEGLPNSTNQPDDFYHASEEMENGEPVVKISLKRNDTGKTRKVMVWVFSNRMYGTLTIFGYVIIYQEPESGEAQPFSLKAKFKDKIYTTEAEIDAEGNYIFHNPEYAQLMKDIDEMPDVNMVLLDNSTIYYYDREDILDNKPYYDAIAVNEGAQPTTRATGFEDFDT